MRAKTWVASLAAVLLVCAFSDRSARADELVSTLGEPLRELSHTVDVTVAEGVATYRVTRVFLNSGKQADEASLSIDLPYGAAATGMRIRARTRWYEAVLMEREQAARLYQELTGRGVWAPKDPALLQWMWADKLHLQVFPVLPGQPSTVEYTLTVPTRYQRGQVFLSYPRLGEQKGSGLATPVLTVRPGWGDARTRITVDDQPLAPGARLPLAAIRLPDWLTALGPLDGAGYVSSVVTVPDARATRGQFKKATVKLDIGHTFRGDLQVDLLTPDGAQVPVATREGGGENDLHGTFAVELPEGTSGPGSWRLVVTDRAALDVGTLDAWSLTLGEARDAPRFAARDLPRFIPDARESASEGGLAEIGIAPPHIDTVTARLGVVVASAEHAFARLELDLAPVLAPLPRQARVVFVVDGSYSMGEEGIPLQLAMVRAYLAHVPDALAEIVIYRRTATRLFGALVPAAQVAGRLAAAQREGKLEPGNGSALEEGVAAAARILADERGELRVVLLTDELLRHAFAPAQVLPVLAMLPAQAIVHVVVPDRDGGAGFGLVRDDDDALAPLAAAHHGMFAHLPLDPENPLKQLEARVLGLVRPVQIDRVKVEGLETDFAGDRDDTLLEGEGARVVAAAAAAPGPVVITGLIWGDPYRLQVEENDGFSRAAAAWLFSEDAYADLSYAEQVVVALLGHVVSPVTSLLAIEPGVRPSTIGLPREMFGTGVGFGSAAGAGSMHASRRPDLRKLLARAVDGCVAQCSPPQGWQVTLTVETTLAEIVDVTAQPGSDGPMAACLGEAAWGLQLGAGFVAAHEDHLLSFR
jgi:subtilisin-like proprotein convertase family protein